MRTFIGFIILESLQDMSPLSGWSPVAERVEDRPGDPDAAVWHVACYQVGEEELRGRLPLLSQAMRRSWYAHFWADEDLCVIMPGRYFWAKTGDRATWEAFITYGDTVGIERKYTERVPTQIPPWVVYNR